ncbi:transcriptional regulatory protein AlgP [Penaeus vannamei]|uniref:transcriptional regulatory protein AlgP n=1 Tax=Penaeus vannamei TaxID=6689 RepID=UPI00387F4F0B
MEDPLAATRLTPTPMNGDALSHYPLASPTRLRPAAAPAARPPAAPAAEPTPAAPGRACAAVPLRHAAPRLPPAAAPARRPHLARFALALRRLRAPARPPPARTTLPNHSSHPAVMPLGPPPPIPPLDEPPNWYATIGSVGGFDDDDEGEKRRARGERDGAALAPPDVTAATPRKVPVTYV